MWTDFCPFVRTVISAKDAVGQKEEKEERVDDADKTLLHWSSSDIRPRISYLQSLLALTFIILSKAKFIYAKENPKTTLPCSTPPK